jgi:hypothetical protein
MELNINVLVCSGDRIVVFAGRRVVPTYRRLRRVLVSCVSTIDAYRMWAVVVVQHFERIPGTVDPAEQPVWCSTFSCCRRKVDWK